MTAASPSKVLVLKLPEGSVYTRLRKQTYFRLSLETSDNRKYVCVRRLRLHVSECFWAFFSLWIQNYPRPPQRIQIEFVCSQTSACIQIHSRETRPTRCPVILVHCPVRDWTRFSIFIDKFCNNPPPQLAPRQHLRTQIHLSTFIFRVFNGDMKVLFLTMMLTYRLMKPPWRNLLIRVFSISDQGS